MLDPLSPREWTIASAHHLLVRAGFGGTPAEVSNFYRLGLQGAVDWLLADKPTDPLIPEWEESESARQNEIDAREARRNGDIQKASELRKEIQKEERRALGSIRDQWIARMITTDRPLQEKLTLFWHGHFATSILKVRKPKWMWLQNETFRSKGSGSFGDLTKAISRDPAMIRWLDLSQSSAGAPNENFARELLELFTMGEGHYTEEDIKESARAFTGYRINPMTGQFFIAYPKHDGGIKTFLDKKGYFDGDGIVDVILENRQCGRFLGRRIWDFFAGIEPTPQFEKLLGDTLRQGNYELRPFLRRIFLSKLFYSPRLTGAQIKSPVQWMVQACRALELDPPPDAISRRWMESLGQQLFAPPNVRGWEGGRSWMSASTITARANFAGEMVGATRDSGNAKKIKNWPPANPAKWIEVNEAKSVEEKAAAMVQRLYGPSYPDAVLEKAIESLRSHGADSDGLRICAHTLMAMPEYQLT